MGIWVHILAIFFAFFGRDRSKSSCSCSCQSGKLSSDHILYCHDFILSALQLEWAKSYSLSTYYQMFSVFSLAALHVTQNSFVYILKIIGAEIEELKVQWNPGLTIFGITIFPV